MYKATVTTDNGIFNYIGATGNKLKIRITNHLHSFRNIKLRYSTSLSKLIWELKERHVKFKVKWEIIKKSRKYQLGNRDCMLCLDELMLIIKHSGSIINERLEIFSNCHHILAASFINYNKNG